MDFYTIARLVNSKDKIPMESAISKAIRNLYAKYGEENLTTLIDGNGNEWTFTCSSNTTLSDFIKKDLVYDTHEQVICSSGYCLKFKDETINGLLMSGVKYAIGGKDLSLPISVSPKRTFKDGYCYLSILVALSPFVLNEDSDVFVTACTEMPLLLGKWPEALDIGKALIWCTQRMPYLLNKVVPNVSVNHSKKIGHVGDQRGPIKNWCILSITTLRQAINFMISHENFDVKFGGDPLVDAYKHLDSCIKRSNMFHYPWIEFNKMIANDAKLAAIVIMSPASLMKLYSWFEDDEGFRRMVAGLETSVSDALTRMIVIKRAMKGIKIHFNGTDFDKSVSILHTQILEYINHLDNAEELNAAAHKFALLVTEKKESFLFYEKGILSTSEYRWRKERGFGLISRGESLCSAFINKCKSYKPKIEQLEKRERVVEFILFWRTIWLFLTSFIYTCGIFLSGWFTLKFIMLGLLRMVARHYLGGSLKPMLWTCVVSIIAVAISAMSYIKATKQTKLQSVPNDRKVTGLMAFVILIIHVFDCDLAMSLSSSFHSVARLTTMLTDETRNILPRLIGTRLQALGDENFIAEIDLEMDPEEVQKETLIMGSMTFGGWLDSKVVSLESYTRELQYGGREVNFIVTPDNHLEVATEMVHTKRVWSSVLGGTGSGKSTRIPIQYLEILKGISTRVQRILICEPSRATVANVAAGLSNFFGEQVYYKHRTKEQAGNMKIQVMTYGSALMKALRDENFVSMFDAVFLDESHCVSAHALTFEALLDRYNKTRKFYMSATPRVGPYQASSKRRFQIQERVVENVDANFWLREQGSGSAYDVTQMGPVVLCFVQGKSQADKLALKVNNSNICGFKGYSLHSSNFDAEYNKVVKASNDGESCFIFCTNILETGVTLNADCVVDFGWTMRPKLNLTEKSLCLESQRVTEFERHQRCGRVGRIKDGFALCCGKTLHGRPPVPPEVVYEAALYSFVHDLDIYSNEFLDTHWLSSITKPQAEVMLSYDLPVFVLRDLVGKDGSMRPEMATALKKHLIQDTQILTKSLSAPSDKWQGWPTAHDLIMRCLKGEENEELKNLSKEKIPFTTFHLFDINLTSFIEACKTYEPRHTFKTKMVGTNRKVFMRVDPENISQCHQVAVCLNAHLKTMLDALVQTKGKIQESKLLNCFPQSKRIVNDQQRRIDVMRRNIIEVENHIQRLEAYDTFVREDNIPETYNTVEFQSVHQHMTLQIDNQNNEEKLKELLTIENADMIKVSDVLIHHGDKIAIGLVAMSGAYLISQVIHAFRSQNHDVHQQHFTLEGKGKPYNRSKRSEAAAVNEAFDMFSNLRDKRRKSKAGSREKPSIVSSLLKKTNPFINFYDIGGDEEVENAIFKTFDGQILHQTTTPNEDVKNLEDAIFYANDNKQVDSKWSSEALPSDIQCHVTLKDGRNVVVDLSKHQHNRMTRTGGLMGYVEHMGEFRQTGSTKLEVQSTIPITKLNSDVGRMVGTISTGGKFRMNAILYGDFIVCPAHIQMMEKPIVLRFEHATCMLESFEVMRFNQCDLIMLRRPNGIAPVKVLAKCQEISRPTHVQLVYRNFSNHSVSISASDVAHPFDNGRWSYSISTKNGMCGAAVVDVTTGCLVGIHVSANDVIKKNFMEPLSQSMINVLQKKEDFFGDNGWVFESTECGYMPGEVTNLQVYKWDIEFDPSRYTVDKMNETAGGWGKISNFHAVKESSGDLTMSLQGGGFELIGQSTSNLCSKHKIIGESTYWNEFKRACPALTDGIEEFEDAYCPSALNREAYYKDLSKYNRKLQCRADLKRLEQARLMVIEDLEMAGMAETRMMLVDEVLGDLDVNTAAGALYACKKKILFNGWDDDKLRSFSLDCYHNLEQGSSVGIWNGSLKDELRPVEKVLANKTRVFTAAPITTLIGGKFLVDDFNKQFYATNLNARHTVGINPWAGGWNRLKEFLGNGTLPFYISGDGSRFDSSLDPILFDQVVKIRKHFFKGKYTEALRNLYHEIIFTPILTESGHIVMKKVGNNSGQPSTVVDNTLILMMCFYYCALEKNSDWGWIRKNFLFVCNGDDQKCAMTRDFLDGGLNFEKELLACGLIYEFDEITSDIKEFPYMSLTMVDNRGRTGFILDPRRIVAINQWMNKKGVLGVAQRAFPAMLHSYNDPWLFAVMHAYLVWLLISYEDELLFLMEQTGENVSYLTPHMVDLLHYGGTVLQVDSDSDGKSDDKRAKKDDSSHGSNDCALVGTNQWVMPKLSNTSKSMGFRKIKGKDMITSTVIRTIPKNVRNLMRNDVATDNQYIQWEAEVREDYDIKDDQKWNTILMAWLLYCANNSTTDKFNPVDVMPVPDGRGDTSDIQIGGFVRASNKVGLRKLMRKFSRETSQMLNELGEMTKWGLQHGIQDKRMIPYAFDFYTFDEYTPTWVREQLGSVKHSALGKGVVDALLVDTKHHDLNTMTRSRNDQKEAYKAPEV